MTPPELLLPSLGSCVAYYTAEYLRVRGLSAAGLTVTVAAAKAQRPARLTKFRVGLSVPRLQDQLHQEGILRAAENCLIHNALRHGPTIAIELEEGIRMADRQEPALAG